MIASPEYIAAGLAHLRRADPILRQVIKQTGPFRLRVRRNAFESLVRSIISQQISTSAADSIQRRLGTLLAPGSITPAKLARQTPARLRRAGISPQKAGYLLDLADKVASQQLRLTRLRQMPDEEVIAQLTEVKGIGVWTAQMFLMFCLGRPNVFPHGDLGIRVALRELYQLKELPGPSDSLKIAAAWNPYCTMASWYCWRSLEFKKRPAVPKV